MTQQEVFERLRMMFPELSADEINFLVSKLLEHPEQRWQRRYPDFNCQAVIRGQSRYASLTITGDTMSVAVESRETLTVVSLN